MKQTLTILLLSIILIGCEHNSPMKKPFIIVEKSTYSGIDKTNYWIYRYEDVNGRNYTFVDEKSYRAGDTLK